MSNFLNDEFIYRLEQFKAKYHDNHNQEIAQQLIEKLPAIESAEVMHALLTESIALWSSSTSKSTFFKPELFSLLVSWQNMLNLRIEQKKLALTLLAKQAIKPTLKPLIHFLQEVITNSKLTLHNQMSSLLALLSKSTLPELLNYLDSLEKVAVSQPLSSSFAAIVPNNAEHKLCIDLLNNLAATIRDNNAFFEDANGILQTALTIYKDMPTAKLELVNYCTLF